MAEEIKDNKNSKQMPVRRWIKLKRRTARLDNEDGDEKVEEVPVISSVPSVKRGTRCRVTPRQ